jgi:outer membrane beta-barrel protein
MFHRIRLNTLQQPLSRLCALLALFAQFGWCGQALADEPAVVPQVDQREVTLPRFPSNDFELGAFIGSYDTQNFGASTVRGLRLGYDITEDFFVQGVYAETRITDEDYRKVFPNGIIGVGKDKLNYYNISVGFNVLPGEVFIGSRWAKPAALYLVAGVGRTRFIDRARQTINFGAGYRVYLGDWVALQLDARNHRFSLDFLGKQHTTHNLEFTAGASLVF